MTQYQMMKKIAECKAKLEFVEREIRDISDFFAMMLFEVKQKLEELEEKLDQEKQNNNQST